MSVPRPLLDVRLLRLKTFEAGIAGALFFRFGVGASAFLLPLMLQLAFGLDALSSGLITFAGALGALAVKPLARGILRRFGFRRLLIVNGVLASTVLLASALFTPTTPHLVITAVLLAGGFLRSLQFTSLSAITYAEIEPRQVGSATGMASVGPAGVGEPRGGGGRHGGRGVGMGAGAFGAGDQRLLGGLRGGRADVDDLGAADAPPAGRCGRRDVRPQAAAARGLERARAVRRAVARSRARSPRRRCWRSTCGTRRSWPRKVARWRTPWGSSPAPRRGRSGWRAARG